MKGLQTALRAVALVVSGLVVAGCGGAESEATPGSEAAPGAKPSALEAIRSGKWMKSPRGVSAQRSGDSEPRSAMAVLFNTTYHETIEVCTVVSGVPYCENVEGYPDTYFDHSGTVTVLTRTRYGDGSYFASFGGSSVSMDGVASTWETGYPGPTVWRHFTLSNVTAPGEFLSQGQSTNTNIYRDLCYIW